MPLAQFPALQKLTNRQKRALADELWQAAVSDKTPISTAHKKILDDRWRTYKSGKAKAITHGEMEQRIFSVPKSKIPAAKWRRIRLFAMDVDGILTDGSLHICSDGTESKNFSVIDGTGLYRLAAAGITTAWISGRRSGATTVRANDLKIPHVLQGSNDKLGQLQKLAAQLKLSPAEIVYMGDDDIDAPAMQWAGIGASVATAMPAALAAADYVAKRPAGDGAVREICDLILAAHAK